MSCIKNGEKTTDNCEFFLFQSVCLVDDDVFLSMSLDSSTETRIPDDCDDDEGLSDFLS